MLNNLLNEINGRSLDVCILYDIACLLETHLKVGIIFHTVKWKDGVEMQNTRITNKIANKILFLGSRASPHFAVCAVSNTHFSQLWT